VIWRQHSFETKTNGKACRVCKKGIQELNISKFRTLKKPLKIKIPVTCMLSKHQGHFYSMSRIAFLQGLVDGRQDTHASGWQFSTSGPSRCGSPRLESLEPLIV